MRTSYRAYRLALAGFILFLLASVSQAQSGVSSGKGAFNSETPRVEAQLLTDMASVAPGSRFRVGVLLRMAPGWHIYWKNSGDTGFATEIEWTSDTLSIDVLQFPAPSVYSESGGLAKTFGYSDEVLLFSTAKVARDIKNDIDLHARVRFLVCKVQCIPGEIELDESIPVSNSPFSAEQSVVTVFDHFAARLPVAAADLGLSIHYQFSALAKQEFEIEIGVTACRDIAKDCDRDVDFVPSPGEFAADFPESAKLLSIQTEPDSVHNPGARLLVRARIFSGQKMPDTLEGVLALRIDNRSAYVSVSFETGLLKVSQVALSPGPDILPAGKESTLTDRTENEQIISIWLFLSLAVLGGLIINFMPCVLPILALKAFRVIEFQGASKKEIRIQALAYLIGVTLSMMLLATTVIALKAAGHSVGWGFQFQQPVFLAFLGSLLVVFALNLFGVFEIKFPLGALGGLGLGNSARVQSFFDGILIVLLATPCTAPFLGTAVGFAMAGSSLTIIAVFMAIGLGLALPYLLFTAIPGLAMKLPKPGPWMKDLQVMLGFLLLATTVWLLWIAGQSTGEAGVVWLIASFLALAFAVWGLGRVQRIASTHVTATLALLLIVVTVTLLIRMPLTRNADISDQQIMTRIWNPTTVRQLVLDGSPVFVNFTADWCVTCKVNERLIFESVRVQDSLQNLGIQWFQADWTRPNETIRAELALHDRAGVPLYLLYRPGDPDHPVILPELLTVKQFIASLEALEQPESAIE